MVLVAPLDWGLGHASRCLPLIDYLQKLHCRVTIAGEGPTIELLKKEFPLLEYIGLKGYQIRYPKKGWFFIPQMIAQIPRIINSILREHGWLKKQLKKQKWDLTISDNRYGLHTKDATTLFITHQPNIITGLGRLIDGLAAKILLHQIEKFSQCWIPDISGEKSIAGKLSNPNPLPINAIHIGLLSRLEKNSTKINEYVLVLLSGPEPQRTILEQLLIKQLEYCNEKILFIRGLPAEQSSMAPTNNINFINYMDAQALSEAMSGAKAVVCRSGYSSVMDLLKLNKKALLIPTPGQTEQLYLAKRLCAIGWFAMEQQEKLDVTIGITNALQLSTARPSLEFEGYKQAFSKMGIK